MDWKKIKLPQGSKLFRVYNFTYMHAGNTYHLEIDEFNDNAFSGHGEHSIDRSRHLESVSGKTIEECLEGLIKKIQ